MAISVQQDLDEVGGQGNTYSWPDAPNYREIRVKRQVRHLAHDQEVTVWEARGASTGCGSGVVARKKPAKRRTAPMNSLM